MKLITKYNRINIIATVIVLLLASICYYFIVRYVLIHQLDNTLKVEEAEILNFVKVNNKLPEATNYRDQHTKFEEVAEPVSRKFDNIKLCEGRHRESDAYRELSFPININGKNYKASVTKSEDEMEDLIKMIVLITIIIIILLVLILFFANRILLGRLWEPFYNTLQSIKQFNFSNKQNILSQTSNIDEFKDLDGAVNAMQTRIIKDYETLKNFADNASHEMQTPLAILNSKLDLLIQEPGLQESHTKQLQAMYDAMSRLTNLNKSLLLLSKIENNQFKKTAPLQFDVLINEKLIQLEDLIHAKHLTVNTNLQQTTVQMDSYLADIFLNNLLSNAIKHNIENGSIVIDLNNEQLIIRNSGTTFDFDESHIFDRFKKGDESEGAGLGLAIVKQICDNYGFKIYYSFTNNFHCFKIQFHTT
ncbi:MAG TPA: HAMP domain-containing sensor histidine kinase [Puia sp.]|nr:HAMP domain-containing sensor histidine kinase [Puia sp.]